MKQSNKKLEAGSNGLDEQDLPLELDHTYQFIFVVDRSGSMG